MFKVPEQFRVRKGRLASDSSFGNNGIFFVPAGKELALDNQGTPTQVPYFLLIVASNQEAWEHVTIMIHTIAAPRAPIKQEVEIVRNMFWNSKDDHVFQYMPSDKYKEEAPLCCHLWRKVVKEDEIRAEAEQLVKDIKEGKKGLKEVFQLLKQDMPVPPVELFGLERKSDIIQMSKNLFKA